ncbi:glycosyltransferase family 4 protein [Ilumatobacter sp.]|uniref:glycosyltransferase family 4 protein n=1 Tax=Ilumatobacter sp. TaxID=1967498 RepID=UPI003B51D594
MPEIGSYLLIGVVAAGVTFATTPLVARLARRRGWVYLPNARTVHTEPLPDVGGLAMFLGFAAALAVAWASGDFASLFRSNSEPIGVVLAAVLIFGTGFLDDVREISAPAKVFGTMLAGIALVWFGVVMDSFRLPYLGETILAPDLKPLVMVLWLLGMSQAVNLIDGLDGLAAGVVGIGAYAFFLYSQEVTARGLIDPGNIGPLFAIIAVGVCLGFLPHNFNPARIMMGDGGALLLGLLLAVATSVVGGRASSGQEFVGTTYFFLAPIAIPLLILGVPMLDTAFAIVRRATTRSSLATADKGHLHHRLINLGHGHRRSVLILWTWTALLSAFVLYPILTDQNPRYLPFGMAALAITLYTVLHPNVIEQRRRNSTPSRGLERPVPASMPGAAAPRPAGAPAPRHAGAPAIDHDGELSTPRPVDPAQARLFELEEIAPVDARGGRGGAEVDVDVIDFDAARRLRRDRRAGRPEPTTAGEGDDPSSSSPADPDDAGRADRRSGAGES